MSFLIDWTTLGSNFKIAQKTDNTVLTLAKQFFCEIDISDIPNGTVLWIFAKIQVGDTGGNGNTVSGAISDQNRTSSIPGSSFYTNLSWGTTTLTSAMYVKDSSKTQLNLFVRKEDSSVPCNLNNATLVVVPISNQK